MNDYVILKVHGLLRVFDYVELCVDNIGIICYVLSWNFFDFDCSLHLNLMLAV